MEMGKHKQQRRSEGTSCEIKGRRGGHMGVNKLFIKLNETQQEEEGKSDEETEK